MELIFLGTGSGIPTPSRFHSSVLFRYGPEIFMLDCGEGAQIRMSRAGISPLKIGRIFITHWHADHFSGLLPLLETMNLMGRTEPIEIYAPEAGRFVYPILELSYSDPGFEVTPVEALGDEKRTLVETEKYLIRSIPTSHGVPSVGFSFVEKDRWKVDPVKVAEAGLSGPEISELKKRGRFRGVRIEEVATRIPGRRVVYSGDTEPVAGVFEEAAGGVLIHDSTFFEDPKYLHSSAREVAELARRYGVKVLILTHFSRKYPRPDLRARTLKKVFPNIFVAKDLSRFRVP